MCNVLVWSHREENKTFHFAIKMFVVVIKMAAFRNDEISLELSLFNFNLSFTYRAVQARPSDCFVTCSQGELRLMS